MRMLTTMHKPTNPAPHYATDVGTPTPGTLTILDRNLQHAPEDCILSRIITINSRLQYVVHMYLDKADKWFALFTPDKKLHEITNKAFCASLDAELTDRWLACEYTDYTINAHDANRHKYVVGLDYHKLTRLNRVSGRLPGKQVMEVVGLGVIMTVLLVMVTIMGFRVLTVVYPYKNHVLGSNAPLASIVYPWNLATPIDTILNDELLPSGEYRDVVLEQVIHGRVTAGYTQQMRAHLTSEFNAKLSKLEQYGE